MSFATDKLTMKQKMSGMRMTGSLIFGSSDPDPALFFLLDPDPICN